ncbi:MAG: PilN domain-containing protein [Candidatus Obscuribacterales bacterium]|nr:PilN domain-containing protein [Steroidobacteraceae bacterium]
MPRINLLPWREADRKRKRQEFYVGIVGAFVVALLLGFMASLRMDAAIDHQNERNQALKDAITEVDKQITEVIGLEEQQARLEARMEVIEQLQRSRPGVVHLFDQIVRIVPDGIHLTSFKQTNAAIQLRGMAQSSTRVAAFMRNIEGSEWLADPALENLENKGSTADASSEFVLNAKQTGTVAEPTVSAAKKPNRAAK